MWFKNLQVYRLATSFKSQVPELTAKLAAHKFEPCTGSQAVSFGWTAPRGNDALVHTANQQILLQYTSEKKILPTSAVAEAVKEDAAIIEQQQGFKPGRKLMKEIKEKVINDLLLRTLSATSNTLVWIDPINGWVVIDASSPGRADDVLRLMLKCINKFPIEILRVKLSPVAAMTDWLANDEAPVGFTIDKDAELRSGSESKASIRYVCHTLEPAEIARHIASGKQCVKLALTWSDKVSFVLTEHLVLKRIKALNILTEKSKAQDEQEQQDGDFVLMCAELTALLTGLVVILGGESEAA